MKVKALVSFSGAISMRKGEERELALGEVLTDLLQANYVQEIVPKKPKKGVKMNED